MIDNFELYLKKIMNEQTTDSEEIYKIMFNEPRALKNKIEEHYAKEFCALPEQFDYKYGHWNFDKMPGWY